MVTILPKEEGWGEIARKFTGAATEGYMDRADEMALQKSVKDLPEGYSPRDLLNAVTNTKTYGKAAKQEFLKNAMGVAEYEQAERKNQAARTEAADKKKLEANNAMALLQASGLTDEQKQAIGTQIDSGEVSLAAVKELVKPPKIAKAEPKSEFEKGLAKENVQRYVESEKDLIEADKTLGDLEKIDELTEKLSGPIGYFKALNPFNEDAAELNSLGYTAIKPIIKIFNPSGPLAQKKLEQILARFGINATDSSAKIKGKVKALRRYAKAAKEISSKRIELIKEYNGNPPLGAMTEIDKIGQNLTDEMAGETKKYYGAKNGKEVIPPDEATRDKWIEQGLITDVKP